MIGLDYLVQPVYQELIKLDNLDLIGLGLLGLASTAEAVFS
jgi:hypothetical protein